MTRSQWQSRNVLAGVVLSSAVISGCSSAGVVPIETERTGAGVVIPLAGDVHQAVVKEADSLYDFEPERRALMVTDHAFRGPTFPDGSIPRMTIATAHLKPNIPRPLHRVIARIRSEGAYPPLGIQPGFNYVWRSSWIDADSLGWRTLIIPRDSSTLHALVRDSRRKEYSHGMSAEEPRLVILSVNSVALGLCLDDPMCNTGHCGYF